jgi:mono/diheme cytochrome c family protein
MRRRCRIAALTLPLLALAAACAARAADAEVDAPAIVPDVLARQAGLRLKPLPRAARLYALNCQGCHGEAGVSVPEVPALAGRAGYFARIPEGRRYLIQVPNVALNASSDEDLAAIMNWVLLTFSRRELPADFRPFTAQEVGQLRTERIDPAARRRHLVDELIAQHRLPSADALALPVIDPY